jgi:hypothetical protein
LDLKVIISHFNNYPLQTTKIINFLYFCEILNLLNDKVHTNTIGFLQLASLINKLNRPARAQRATVAAAGGATFIRIFSRKIGKIRFFIFFFPKKKAFFNKKTNMEFKTPVDLDIAKKVEKLDPARLFFFIPPFYFPPNKGGEKGGVKKAFLTKNSSSARRIVTLYTVRVPILFEYLVL